MTPHFDPTAPAFISIAQKPGGFNLRTRSAAAAQERIATFLACGDSPTLVATEIAVTEPASAALLRSFFPRITPHTAAVSTQSLKPHEIDERVARHEHSLDAVTAALWATHGAPSVVGVVRKPDNTLRVRWTWAGTPDDYAAWSVHVASESVHLTAAWDLRLRLRDGSLVEPPLPASRFVAMFGGTRATAYCYFVLPQMPVTPQLTDEWDHLTARTGVKLPFGKFELCAPGRDGTGRAWRKLR